MKVTSIQEAFDIIWKHFIINRAAPGHDSASGACVYENADGVHCAVGVLLTEEELQDIKESGCMRMAIKDVLRHEIVVVPDYRFERFLSDVQQAHDWKYPEEEGDGWHESFRDKLTELAETYKLQTPTEARTA